MNSDTVTESLAQAALGGLTNASAGIQTILEAIVANQTAPSTARDQVGNGLTEAEISLVNITS